MSFQNTIYEGLQKMSEDEKDTFITQICLLFDNASYSPVELKEKILIAIRDDLKIEIS